MEILDILKQILYLVVITSIPVITKYALDTLNKKIDSIQTDDEYSK